MPLSQSRSSEEYQAITGLYERCWLPILIYVRQFIPSLEDAEDILLEVFLAALESDAFFTLREKQQLAWLHTTAHHKCMDHYRRSARHPSVSLLEVAERLFEDDARAPEQKALRHEEQASLHAHLSALSEQQQEVLRLRFAEDLRCAEIARRMNKSEVAIRSLLSRTLTLLRRFFDRSEEEIYHG